jgi:hypothetical protein
MVALAPASADACSPYTCIDAAFAPRDGGVVPANGTLAFRPSGDYYEGNPPDGLAIVRVEDGAPIAFEVVADPRVDRSYAVRFEAEPEPGVYRASFPDRGCYGEPPQPDHQVLFTVTPAAARPTWAGQPRADASGRDTIEVFTSSGACFTAIDAALATVGVIPGCDTSPWRDVARYSLGIDRYWEGDRLRAGGRAAARRPRRARSRGPRRPPPSGSPGSSGRAGLGFAARFALRQFRPPAGGLFPVLTLGLALVAFGLPTLLGGSGFLAVHAAGVVIGNGPLPYRTGVLRVHDAIAWLGQVGMFLLLGLLAVPSRLLDVAAPGVGLALFLALVARPVAVALCLLPFRYQLREVIYVGWVGLRGAVPIILATYPVLAHAPGAGRIFDVVFFVVAANALVPGGTVGRATRWLRQASLAPPPPHAVLEIASTQDLRGEVMSFYVAPVSVVSGSRMSELPFPPGSAAMLLVRGRELIAPRGDTVLAPGDHVYVFSLPEDRPFVLLMFGTPEEE